MSISSLSTRIRVSRYGAWIGIAFVIVGCATPGEKPPVTTAPSKDAAKAPVVRQTLPGVPIPPVNPDTDKAALPPMLPVVVPPNTLYVCVVDAKGERQQTAIEFSPKVQQLCRKHPEMGPCQYERDACRRGGGRVFAANGMEITRLTEAEYDKRVLRVRFRAD